MFLRALVSGLTPTPEMERANIRSLVFILALAALLLRAVVALRVAPLPLSFAFIFLTFTLAVPAGFILIFVDEGPAPVGDRFRELGASPREPISLNHPEAKADQVII